MSSFISRCGLLFILDTALLMPGFLVALLLTYFHFLYFSPTPEAFPVFFDLFRIGLMYWIPCTMINNAIFFKPCSIEEDDEENDENLTKIEIYLLSALAVLFVALWLLSLSS